MKTISTGLLVLGSLTFLLFSVASRAETLNYEVVKKYKDFEIRRYPSYLVAEVEAKADFGNAAYVSFRHLFDYISGNNIKHENIAMTSPVSQQASSKGGEKIAMTSPVIQEPDAGKGAGNTYRVGFTMPAKYNISNIPQPLDPEVKIREIPARLVAARTYSGSWGQTKFENNEKILLDAIKKEGLEASGIPIFARYNQPLTLPWNRRNEVLVEIKG